VVFPSGVAAGAPQTEQEVAPVTPPTRMGFGTHVSGGDYRGHVGCNVGLYWLADGLVCEIAVPT